MNIKEEKKPEIVSDLILITYYIIAYIVKKVFSIKKFITNNFCLFAIALISIGCFDYASCHLSLYRNVTEFANYQIYKDNFIKIRCLSNHLKGSSNNRTESLIHDYSEENAKNLKLVFAIIVAFFLFDRLYNLIIYLAKLVRLIGRKERGDLAEMTMFIFTQMRLIIIIFLFKILVRSLLGSVGFIGLHIRNRLFSQADSKIMNFLFDMINKFKYFHFDFSSLIGINLNDLIEYLDLEIKSNVQISIDHNVTSDVIKKLGNENLKLVNVQFSDYFVIFLNYNLELFYSLFLVFQFLFIFLLLIELILFATRIQKFLSTNSNSYKDSSRDNKEDNKNSKDNSKNNSEEIKKVLKTENSSNDKCKKNRQISSADSSIKTDLTTQEVHI